MTPKEKAIELCVKFFKPSVFKYEEKQYAVDEEKAKQYALICVDEMLKNIPKEVISCNPFMMNTDYWEVVKQEIKKL